MAKTSTTLLTTSVLLAGCMRGPHVQLSSPPASAPSEERLAAFENLQPQSTAGTVTVAGSQPVAQTTDFIVLGDGRRVYHANDLVAVVPADSPTARAGRNSQAAQDRGDTWYKVALGIALVGVAMTTYSALTAGDPGDEDFGPGPLFVVGLGVAGAGIGTGFFAGREYKIAHDERVTAFSTYRKDLMKGLDLCVDGLELKPCDVSTPAPGAGPAASQGASAEESTLAQ